MQISWRASTRLVWAGQNNRLWVEYNKNKLFKQHNDWMHKCLPHDATYSAVFAVCLSWWCIETAFFIAWRRLAPSLVFQKGPDCEIPTGLPSTGAPNRGGVYQKFAIFNQYFRNIDTDTEYRTDMKKIPTKIPNTDTDSKYRYRPSSSIF